LVIQRLRLESPIEIVATTVALTAAGAGAIWAAVQAIDRVYTMRLNRRKAELEVRKLELELERLELENAQSRHFVPTALVSSDQVPMIRGGGSVIGESEAVIRTIERRLRQNPIQVDEVEVEYDEGVEPPA
jgi:hypothetical protein